MAWKNFITRFCVFVCFGSFVSLIICWIEYCLRAKRFLFGDVLFRFCVIWTASRLKESRERLVYGLTNYEIKFLQARNLCLFMFIYLIPKSKKRCLNYAVKILVEFLGCFRLMALFILSLKVVLGFAKFHKAHGSSAKLRELRRSVLGYNVVEIRIPLISVAKHDTPVWRNVEQDWTLCVGEKLSDIWCLLKILLVSKKSFQQKF